MLYFWPQQADDYVSDTSFPAYFQNHLPQHQKPGRIPYYIYPTRQVTDAPLFQYFFNF